VPFFPFLFFPLAIPLAEPLPFSDKAALEPFAEDLVDRFVERFPEERETIAKKEKGARKKKRGTWANQAKGLVLTNQIYPYHAGKFAHLWQVNSQSVLNLLQF